MFNYIKNKIGKEKNENEIKKEFIQFFIKNQNHYWINEDKATKRIIDILLNSLSIQHIEFFKKNPTFLIPCQAHLSCAIGRTQNHHLVLVFPELVQLLKSASGLHGAAILAHELGHIYHKHTEKKIETLTAQIEADDFAFNLGFGEELQEVLLDHAYSIDCRVRIAKLTSKLITQK